MEISDMELINANIRANGITISDALEDIVKEFKASERRVKAVYSWDYYKNNADIDNKQRTYVDKNGTTRTLKNNANTKTKHNLHRVIVDGDVGFMLGNDPSINTNVEGELDKVFNVIKKDKLFAYLKTWMKNAENGGIGFLHPFIDSNNQLKFKAFSSDEILPQFNRMTGELEVAYWIYPVRIGGKVRYKVNVIDTEKTTTYIQTEKGYVLDTSEEENPRFHITSVNTANGNTEAIGWGFVPMIPLFINEEGIANLNMYKDLIDDYDKMKSTFSDTIYDNAKPFKKIVGFKGEVDNKGNRTDRSQYLKNMMETGVAFIPENGDIANVTTPIETQAVDTQLKRNRNDLFIAGMSVDFNTDEMGTAPSGKSLEFQYTLLKNKVGNILPLFRDSFELLLNAINRYLELTSQETLDVDSFSINFNLQEVKDYKTILEAMTEAGASIRTKLEVIPYVNNVDQEFDRLREEMSMEENMLPPIV